MEVREDDEDFKNPVDLMFEELKKRKPDHFAVRQYAKFKLSAGKTAKSILISCGDVYKRQLTILRKGLKQYGCISR